MLRRVPNPSGERLAGLIHAMDKSARFDSAVLRLYLSLEGSRVSNWAVRRCGDTG